MVIVKVHFENKVNSFENLESKKRLNTHSQDLRSQSYIINLMIKMTKLLL